MLVSTDIRTYDADAQLLCNRLYEYKKGVRHLFLCTVSSAFADWACERLNRNDVDYFLQSVPGRKDRVNLFFGRSECIEAVRIMLVQRSLTELSDEEDFILGIMLGYDTCMQCNRYCKRKEKHQPEKEVKSQSQAQKQLPIRREGAPLTVINVAQSEGKHTFESCLV